MTTGNKTINFIGIILVVLVISSSCCSDDSIPVFKVQGQHYDVGYKIGQQLKKEIQNLYFNFEVLFGELLPYFDTDEGYKVFTEYLVIVNETYPGYLDELYGLSEGAFIPFDRIFLMHIRPEIELLLQEQGKISKMTSSCSDVMLNYKDLVSGQQYSLHAHNEDTDTINKGQVFILNVVIIDDSGEEKENFTVLSYAGQIFGVFLGFNIHGLSFSANSLFPKGTQRNKTPILFMSRAAFAAKNLDEALSVCLHDKYGAATGFSVNIGFTSESGEPTLMNIEVAPDHMKGKTSWNNITLPVMNNSNDGHYYHFNMYKHSQVAQYDDPSSDHRQTRANQLPVPANLTGILNILGDTKDKDYPLYRTGSTKDTDATVVTGVFDLVKRTWSLYNENPKTSRKPVLIMNLPKPQLNSSRES
ncbi:beta-alanyl-dopamine/carcinine hydrolase-like [Glandiceps talaboti]